MEYATHPHNSSVPIEPFKVSIPDKDVDELKMLLKLGRISKKCYENSDATENNFGVTRQWMEEMRDEWLALDWKAHEEEINTFPQYIAQVKDQQGKEYSIHYAALFSKKKDAIPIVLSHGWPGSYLEFYSVFEVVRQKYSPENLPFHLVAPSLPGWLFSSPPPNDRDFGMVDVAFLFDGLMKGLGFGGGYVAQGGDIGSFVSTTLGLIHPACRLVHLNFHLMFFPPPGTKEIQSQDAADKDAKASAPADPLTPFQNFGYALEHGTRPATIGITVGSNPIALLAWIGEKLEACPDKPWTRSMMLRFLSLYWFTDCFATTIYAYRIVFGKTRGSFWGKGGYQKCPTGFSSFPYEITPAPEEWLKPIMNLVWYKQHDKGGHFAALGQPELLWGDVEEYVGKHWGRYEKKTASM